ncbi:MAG: carboxypeptidase-like regulatory domain-containing protein [Pyrinomonadaceae bacterium]
MNDKDFNSKAMILCKSTSLLFISLLFAVPCLAQQTGSVKGKVRVESGAGAAGVAVIARQKEQEIARAETDRKGNFTLNGLAPGVYELMFRRTGLSVGSIENIEVQAGKTRTLNDRLVLTVDAGSIAYVRGSVFDGQGRSVPGVRVELARLAADGMAKRVDERPTGESGEFVFRLPPDKARYRVTVKAKGAAPAMKDVEVEGAAIYRIALSLQPANDK